MNLMRNSRNSNLKKVISLVNSIENLIRFGKMLCNEHHMFGIRNILKMLRVFNIQRLAVLGILAFGQDNHFSI
jgi:hypothetical protein